MSMTVQYLQCMLSKQKGSWKFLLWDYLKQSTKRKETLSSGYVKFYCKCTLLQFLKLKIIFNALVSSFIIIWLLIHKDTIKQINDTKSFIIINTFLKNCQNRLQMHTNFLTFYVNPFAATIDVEWAQLASFSLSFHVFYFPHSILSDFF